MIKIQYNGRFVLGTTRNNIKHKNYFKYLKKKKKKYLSKTYIKIYQNTYTYFWYTKYIKKIRSEYFYSKSTKEETTHTESWKKNMKPQA